MNRWQFVLALWSATGLTAALHADDCDCSKGPICQCRDDSGILDHVDKVAGQFHASFKRNLSLISRLERIGPRFDNSPKCDGEIKPSCGCENAPSCGCEIKPSCGCEIKPGCGCEIHSATGSGAIESEMSPLPISTPPTHPTRESNPPSLSAPQSDSQVNPFADEPRSSQSKVRGRTIQYRTNNTHQHVVPPQNQQFPSTRQQPTYGQQYDTQARSIPVTLDNSSSNKNVQRPLQLVAPASVESPTVGQVFKSAYRVSLSDKAEQDSSLQPVGSGLRPVPSSSKVEPASVGSSSSRRSSRVIVPTEPIRDLNDPYEREDSYPVAPVENPLRR